MRIRKRQAVMLETSRPTVSLSGVNGPVGSADADRFVGQTSCTCCSQQRQLQYWELRNAVAQEDYEPSYRYAGGDSVTDNNQDSPSEARTVDYVRVGRQHSETEKFGECSGRDTTTEDVHNSEISEVEEKEPNLAATLERLGGFGRTRGNEHDTQTTANRAQVCVTAQSPFSEGDGNHPGNKPKESLLYSLYCVFSKLSGKAVLTAREALSRIIEQRLPGLDEDAGLPSVQVAKVMRSNPYFVHLEGGKFFLCSGLSTDSKDCPDSGYFLDSEDLPRSTSPSCRPKIGPLNDFSNVESLKEEQQPVSPEVVRNKRARSKGAVVVVDGCGSDKIECRSRGSKRGQTALNSVSHKGYDRPDIGEPICKRYDGRGWKCNEKALEGYSMCRHHHELIVTRLARLRNSGRTGSKKSAKRRKANVKPVIENVAVMSEGELTVSSEQSGAHCWKIVKARSLKSINN